MFIVKSIRRKKLKKQLRYAERKQLKNWLSWSQSPSILHAKSKISTQIWLFCQTNSQKDFCENINLVNLS